MVQEVVETSTSLIYQKQEDHRECICPPKKGSTSMCKLHSTAFRKCRCWKIKADDATPVWTPSANAFFDGIFNYLIR